MHLAYLTLPFDRPLKLQNALTQSVCLPRYRPSRELEASFPCSVVVQCVVDLAGIGRKDGASPRADELSRQGVRFSSPNSAGEAERHVDPDGRHSQKRFKQPL